MTGADFIGSEMIRIDVGHLPRLGAHARCPICRFCDKNSLAEPLQNFSSASSTQAGRGKKKKRPPWSEPRRASPESGKGSVVSAEAGTPRVHPSGPSRRRSRLGALCLTTMIYDSISAEAKRRVQILKNRKNALKTVFLLRTGQFEGGAHACDVRNGDTRHLRIR